MSPLQRVIGIGQVAEASDVLVEMISLEIREAGAMLQWRARTTEEGFLGDADVAISDDMGTVYNVIPAGSTGSGHASSGEMIVTPHPPAEARRLVIDVRSFGGRDWMPGLPAMRNETVVGPWRFEVELGP